VDNEFRAYEFDHGSQEDPEWKQYLEVLYPSEDDRERMSNRSVLEVLERKGDTLRTPRDIAHWIYFRSNEDREAFKDAVRALEYRIQSEAEKTDEDYPLGLCIVRFQSVKHAEIDDAVIELCRLARTHHGSYDGWETEVIFQAAPKGSE
jgi:regulator of RNase E activity RraB